MTVELKRATESDIELISNLANSIWNDHYIPIIGKIQVDYMLNKMYSFESLKTHIDRGPQQFFILKFSGNPIGFLAFEVKENNEGFLNKFYILSSEQNKGLGKKSFDLLLEQFPNINTIRLQVNRENIKPINFYFQLGFKIEKAEDFNIGDGFFMNDFVMIYKKT
jgi:ribosomal protein S18 acetylase RimI-like enzyme